MRDSRTRPVRGACCTASGRALQGGLAAASQYPGRPGPGAGHLRHRLRKAHGNRGDGLPGELAADRVAQPLHRRPAPPAVARRSYRPTRTEEVIQLTSDGFDPEELLQQSQDEHALEQAFLQLTDTQRTLLSLRAEGYELPEIEAITGIDRKVLSARLNRARVTLAHRLIEHKRVSNRRAGSQP